MNRDRRLRRRWRLIAVWPLVAMTAASAQTRDTALPPLQHAGIEQLVDALAIDAEILLLTDPFWQPAIAALVAANPDRPDAARTFATAARDRERAAYRPLVAFMLDRNLPVGIHPDLAEQVRRLADCQGAACTAERDQRAARYQQVQAEGAKRFRAALPALIAQAASADARTLRDLNRKGLWNCHGSRGRWLSKAAEDQHNAGCAPLIGHPLVRRLKGSATGSRLIVAETTAFTQLAGMVAMGHAAGISLYRLLPPDAVRAAGLTVPPKNLSWEEMAGGAAASAEGAGR